MIIRQFPIPGSPLIGPALLPDTGTPVRSLCLMLHGFSGSGHTMIENASRFSSAFPTTAFLAPNGQGPQPFGPLTYNWFPTLEEPSPGTIAVNAATVRPVLETYISRALDHLNIAIRSFAMIGFSQGGALSLETGIRGRLRIPRVACLSGFLPDPEHIRQTARQRPRVFLSHGTNDGIVDFRNFEVSRTALGAINVPTQTQVQNGSGHWVTPQTWDALGAFLDPTLG